MFVATGSLLLGLTLSGCEPSDDDGEVSGSYKPLFLPATLVWNGNTWTIQGEKAVLTPIGTFSIGAKYKLDRLSDDDVRIIMRDAKSNSDTIYELTNRTGEFSATINGTTKIAVENRTVTIDVTDSRVQTVEFQPSQKLPEEAAAPSSPVAGKWNEFWRSNFYHPYALTSWVYDDSIIGKAYGLGTLWYLVRLVVSVVTAIIETFLTVFCFGTAVVYLIFGPTGRNVTYGLGALIVGFPILAFIRSIFRY